METLPNIDINIKQGNSLVSRFELKGTYKHFTDRERKRLKELTRTYKEKVALYKDIPGAKGVIRQEIEQLKKEFGGFSSFKDKDYRELKEKEAQLMQSVMIFDEKDMEQREKLAQDQLIAEHQVALSRLQNRRVRQDGRLPKSVPRTRSADPECWTGRYSCR